MCSAVYAVYAAYAAIGKVPKSNYERFEVKVSTRKTVFLHDERITTTVPSVLVPCWPMIAHLLYEASVAWGMATWMMDDASPTGSAQALNTHWTTGPVQQAQESCFQLPTHQPVLSGSWDLGPGVLISWLARPSEASQRSEPELSVPSSDVDLTR